VWHEKWGEQYGKDGDACLKYTDRWSESQQYGGGMTKQGDKWREEFKSGTGNKTGETWHEHADGSRCAFLLLSACMPLTNSQKKEVVAIAHLGVSSVKFLLLLYVTHLPLQQQTPCYPSSASFPFLPHSRGICSVPQTQFSEIKHVRRW
jgi:hypothetical protein